jgi:hypothetical protein
MSLVDKATWRGICRLFVMGISDQPFDAGIEITARARYALDAGT